MSYLLENEEVFLMRKKKVNRSSSTKITVFSISGFYFYIEASLQSWGEVARFESPKIQSNGNTTCMVFYYHLYGQTIETLRVKVGDQVLWEISGGQGNNWYKATVPLNYVGIYRVRNYRGIFRRNCVHSVFSTDQFALTWPIRIRAINAFRLRTCYLDKCRKSVVWTGEGKSRC